MGKKITPEQGFPVRVYLQKELDEAESGETAVLKECASDEESWNSIRIGIIESVGAVLKLTNNGVCGTTRQLKTLGNMIDATASSQNEHEPGVVMTATLANSFRLQCEDCLNENCNMRDPRFPVEEVRKSLPIIK